MKRLMMALAVLVASWRVGAAPPAIQTNELTAEQVRMVQRSLTSLGFTASLTGQFDEQTEEALVRFQRARGIAPVGGLDEPTIHALAIDPREFTPVRGHLAEPSRGQNDNGVDSQGT